MKITAKKVEQNIQKIVVGNYTFQMDLNNAYIVNGYYLCNFISPVDDNNCDIYSFVLDKGLNVVFPLRIERASNEEINNDEINSGVYVFKNDLLLFKGDGMCYLVDLKDTKFIEKENDYIPDKYLLKAEEMKLLKDENLMVYNFNETYLYDTKNKRITSNKFNFIKETNKDDLFEAYLFFYDKMLGECFLKKYINYDFKENKVISVNDVITLVPPKDLKEEDLIKYCDDELIKEVNKRKKGKCIIIH